MKVVTTNDLEIPFIPETWSDPSPPTDKYENYSNEELELRLNEEINKFGQEFENLKNHLSKVLKDGEELYEELDVLMNQVSQKEEVLNSKKSSLMDFINCIQKS